LADVDIDALKHRVVTASHVLHDQGMVEGYGHISVRIPGTDRFLIPPRMSPALVQFEDVLTMNLAGQKVDGKKQPNSEVWLHTCIYRARPDVGSIAHTHSKYVIVLGIVGQLVRPVHNGGVYFSLGTKLYTRPGTITTEALGNEVAEKLGDGVALMLRGHGGIVVSPDLERTARLAIDFEEAAMFQFLASQIGQPIDYTAAEMAGNSVLDREFTEDQKIKYQRGWDYYVSRLS
jgi:ribulose-5-phosphate 4-epimerase/fuculose-1-phosphate aldolase